MSDLLFVYGTLRSEFDNPHARNLRAHAESLGHITISGSLFKADAYSGYRAQPAGIVHGELYRLATPGATFAALDEYEGTLYRRILIDTPHGPAWIYAYEGPVRDDERIESGDFCNS